jgi:pimeloyl-ACP methyl ester carboxylesterase
MKLIIKTVVLVIMFGLNITIKAQKMAQLKQGSKTHEFTLDKMPEVKEHYVTLPSGVSLRYLKVGNRREPLLLIHTIRTQADYYYKLIPLLKNNYTVYAIDLPGHGYSDLKIDSYTEEYFRRISKEFLKSLKLKKVTLVGESIGGVLALTIAADIPEYINKVYALNPYDYGEKFGGGIRRSKNGWIISLFSFFKSMTVEPRFILKKALLGGLINENNLEKDFLKELYKVGGRRGYRKGEYNVFSNWESWINARELYAKIKAPVVFIYGKNDWSYSDERQQNLKSVKNASIIEMTQTSHFSALENPQKIAEIILNRKN